MVDKDLRLITASDDDTVGVDLNSNRKLAYGSAAFDETITRDFDRLHCIRIVITNYFLLVRT